MVSVFLSDPILCPLLRLFAHKLTKYDQNMTVKRHGALYIKHFGSKWMAFTDANEAMFNLLP